jgi:YD repeat-containing protein
MNRKRYLSTAILATIMIFGVMLQSDIITMVSSDISVPMEASMTVYDPLEDLIHIYTGTSAEEYFDFVDVELVSLQLKGEVPELGCTITVRAVPPVEIDNIVWYTLMLDENNDPSDNCPNYPTQDVDTMYTVIYTKAGGWTVERAKYKVLGSWWMVEYTEASFGLASSIPGGFSIDIRIPLVELPKLTEVLPWKVKTETFTYPTTFPATGDFVPNEGLAFLGGKPSIIITYPLRGQKVTLPAKNITGYVTDPTIMEVGYEVSSILHRENGTVKVLNGKFSFNANLTEGYNIITISDGINEENLILTLDMSAPMVMLSTDLNFNRINAFNVFTLGTCYFPAPTFGFDMWDEKEEYFTEGPSKGLLRCQERNYYRNGKKVGDEHVRWEYHEEGPAKGKPKRKITTFTDRDGKPVQDLEGGTTEYTYDENGRLISETFTPPVAGWITRKFKYEYDEKNRVKKRTEIFEKDGKYLGKQIREYEYDEKERVRKEKTTSYDPHANLDFEATCEYQYNEKGKLLKRIMVYNIGEITLRFQWTYEYDEKNRIIKVVKEEIIPGAEVEKEITTYEYTGNKVKVTRTKNPNLKTIQVMECRYNTSLLNIAEPTTLQFKTLISDTSPNPMIPHADMLTVTVSIVNSTGSYDSTFSTINGYLEFIASVSMNTTITIMVMDEAGHIGVNTIQIPLPLVSDIDCNNVVNIIDIAMAAKAFGAVLGGERWDFFADVNSDDIVNILDIAMVARDFGKTY